jgi:hypothetical protein
VNCDAARDLLPEHALGVAGVKGRAVGEHLAWCAACRKEARDLQRASATLAFALAPAPTPEELEDRVVERVRAEAGLPASGRRPRRSLTLIVAAAVALAGLGGGAVLARRDPGPIPAVEADRHQDQLAQLGQLIRSQRLAGRDTKASLAVLMPGNGGPEGGSAMAITGPTVRDRVIVITSTLPADQAATPYTVWLADAKGAFVRVGKVAALNASGGFTVGRIVDRDLTGFVNVLVRNARGKVVLSGTLTEDTSFPSPAP